MTRLTLSRAWRLRFFLVPMLFVLTLLPAHTPSAAAHPLGNFTINLYSRLLVGQDRIDITYVVDMAEIPTFQEWAGKIPDAAERAAYLQRQEGRLRDNLRLVVDGQPASLNVVERSLDFPQGQGGLATTRLALRLTAMVPELAAGAERQLQYEDANYPDRLGWHELVVQAGPGVRLAHSDAPAVDVSNELRAYPEDMLQSPLDRRSARASLIAGASASPDARPAVQVAAPAEDRLAALITTEQLSPMLLLAALLVAFGLGAAHALSPGLGKTIVGAYLVGSRGTAWHALFLGLTVTITHTAGVFALGLVTLYASQYVLPEQLYPWLGVASGALVVGMGVSLFFQRLRAARHGRPRVHDHTHAHDHDHDHSHDRDRHSHDHAHDHHHGLTHAHGGHTHSHLPPGADGSPITWGSLIALGVSGGLLPCPSALLVMLSAISLGRVGLGLLLIVAFSLGLAATLSAVGLLFVHGGRWIARAGRGRIQLPGLRLIPVAGALVVTMAGIAITAQAMAQTGILN